VRALPGLALAAVLGLALAATASGGELRLTNGSRLEAELANETILFSTQGGFVELAPDQIVELTPSQAVLRDGRAFRGVLAGPGIKAETALGELAVRSVELVSYRASQVSAEPAARAEPAPPPAGIAAAVAPVAAPAPGLGPTPGMRGTLRRFEVLVGESELYRDAYAAAARVGSVVRGELLIYVDFIDRRVRILNALIFDGGHWIKVRAPDGQEGWLPANVLREVR
jgi:hypothetical protein